MKSQVWVRGTALFAVERRARDLLGQQISHGVIALLNIIDLHLDHQRDGIYTVFFKLVVCEVM